MKCSDCQKTIKSTESYMDFTNPRRLFCAECSNKQLFDRITMSYEIGAKYVKFCFNFTGAIDKFFNMNNNSEQAIRSSIQGLFFRRLLYYLTDFQYRQTDIFVDNTNYNKVFMYISTINDDDNVLKLIENIISKFFVNEI